MRLRAGYSLVEMVVVLTIVGIIAAVTAPKVLGVSATSTDNALKSTLRTVRDAIDAYAAEHGGALPGADGKSEAAFKEDLSPYLRGEFPACPVGPARNSGVRITIGVNQIIGLPVPSKGWHYNVVTGQFIVDYSGVSSDGVTRYDDF